MICYHPGCAVAACWQRLRRARGVGSTKRTTPDRIQEQRAEKTAHRLRKIITPNRATHPQNHRLCRDWRMCRAVAKRLLSPRTLPVSTNRNSSSPIVFSVAQSNSLIKKVYMTSTIHIPAPKAPRSPESQLAGSIATEHRQRRSEVCETSSEGQIPYSIS